MAVVSRAMARCLAALRDAEAAEDWSAAEIVCDGIFCYQAENRVSYRTVRALLHLLLVSETAEGKVRRYSLNDCGRGVLARPELADEIAAQIARNQPFTVTSDHRIAPL